MFRNRSASEEFGVLVPEEMSKEPEHRLMLAVLEEALATFQRGLNSTVAVERKDFFKVMQWIRSRDCEWPFSFENICSTFRISPDYVRAGLAAMQRSAFEERATAKRRKVRRERIYDRRAWRGQVGGS